MIRKDVIRLRRVLKACLVALVVFTLAFLNYSQGVYFSPGIGSQLFGEIFLVSLVIGLLIVLIVIIFILHFLNSEDFNNS